MATRSRAPAVACHRSHPNRKTSEVIATTAIQTSTNCVKWAIHSWAPPKLSARVHTPLGHFQGHKSRLSRSSPSTVFQQMLKSIGCSGCLTICCAIVRKCGSSMRKGLFRYGIRQAEARSNAGHAQASTAAAEAFRGAPTSFMTSVFIFVSQSPHLAVESCATFCPSEYPPSCGYPTLRLP